MEKRFTVEGMSCAACSASVERVVGKLDFVKKAEVNLLAKTLLCDYEGTAQNTEKIIIAIKKAGFEAFLQQEKAEPDLKEITKSQTKSNITLRLTVSAVLCVILMYVAMGNMLKAPFTDWLCKAENTVFNGILQLLLTIPVLVLNRDFFIKGFGAILKGRANMDSLVASGATASVIYGIYALLHVSLALGNGNLNIVSNLRSSFYFDSAAMILTLVTVGKALEEHSKKKTGNALKGLIELAPKYAHLIKNGIEIEVKPEELVAGDIFIVRPGERIAADGVIVEGSGAVDESALTGESMPIEKNVGDKVLTACINLNGALTVRAEKTGKETALSHIIELVESAGASKAPVARLADKVSGIFVPIVMSVSAITFLIWLIAGGSAGFALARAVSVLVISCPCALGLATPVAMTVSMGKSASQGILIKNAETIELLQKVDTVIFDKTGTLTKGKPLVTDVKSLISEDELLSLAYSLECKSEHPLAKAVNEYCMQKNTVLQDVMDFRAVTGSGVEGCIDSKPCIAGNEEFLKQNGVNVGTLKTDAERLYKEGKTVLYFAKGGIPIGIIAIADEIREESVKAVKILKKNRIRTVMLTGDNKTVAEAVGKTVAVDEIISDVKPSDKESVVTQEQANGRFVLMVGDGINDSPALTRANVGCAMGNGTEIAIDSANMVLLHNNPLHIPQQILFSKRTVRNIKQNLFWAFFYNTLGIPIAAGVLYSAFGIVLSPMIGAAAMSFSSLFVVSNALRLYKNKKEFSK